MIDSNKMIQTQSNTDNKTRVLQEVRIVIGFSNLCYCNDAIQLTPYHLQSNHNLNQPRKQFLLNALQNHVIQW